MVCRREEKSNASEDEFTDAPLPWLGPCENTLILQRKPSPFDSYSDAFLEQLLPLTIDLKKLSCPFKSLMDLLDLFLDIHTRQCLPLLLCLSSIQLSIIA